MKGRHRNLKRLGGLAALLTAMPSFATELDFGPGWTANWNNSFTELSMWRATDRNTALYTAGDGAQVGLTGSKTGVAQVGYDAGDLNYRNGDLIETRLTWLSEFNVEKDNAGITVSGKAWTNKLGENRNVRYGDESNAYTPNQPLDDGSLPMLTRQSGIYLLDAFAYDSFDVLDHPLQVRVGNQVLNWGESLFVQGINQISPLDLSVLRVPGTEIKEAFLPVPMASASLGLGHGIALDGFLQFYNVANAIDSCGNYFSLTEMTLSNKPGSCNVTTFLGTPNSQIGLQTGSYVPTVEGPSPHNFNQFGFGLHVPVDAIDTEFGLFYTNLTARTPMLSAVSGNDWQGTVRGVISGAVGSALPGAVAANCGSVPAAAKAACTAAVTAAVTSQVTQAVESQLGVGALLIQPLQVLGKAFGVPAAQSFFTYPENIKDLGISATTTLWGWSVGSELSYSPNYPVQINGDDLIIGEVLGLGPMGTTFQKAATTALGGRPGIITNGYTEFRKWQYQINGVNLYANVLGAEQLTVASEIAFEWADVPKYSTGAIRYGRAIPYGNGSDASFGNAPAAELAALGIGAGGNTCAGLNPGSAGCQNTGYDTPFAWGVRLRGELQYNNIFDTPINFFPSFSFSADVNGVSVDNQFIKDRRQYGIGLRFNYQERYTMQVNYITNNHDAKYDPLEDRDFVSLSFSAKF